MRSNEEKYLEEGGTKCLHCDSGEIEGGYVNIEGGEAWQAVTCNDCLAEWTDIYTLTGIDRSLSRMGGGFCVEVYAGPLMRGKKEA